MNLPQGVSVQPNVYQQNILQPPARPAEAPTPPQGVAIRPVAATPKPASVQTYQQAVAPEPEVRIVRRNLTVAELIAVILIAMVGLSAAQFVWSAIPKPQVNIEWKR